jgi:hypothetical protein
MILAALLFSAGLAAADPPPAADVQASPRLGPHALPNTPRTERIPSAPRGAAFASPPPIAERTPNLYKVPEQCKGAPVKVQDRFGRPVAEKLGDLPKGALIYAVDRRVDGCPVLVVVYGTPALDNPNPPPPSGPEKVTPAKHEDAPSNRR